MVIIINDPEFGLYKMSFDYGKWACVEGIFIAPKIYVDTLLSRKIHIYFGEILGDLSCVDHLIGDGEINLITDEEPILDIIRKYKLESGHNPFDYATYGVGDNLEGLNVGDYIEKILDPDCINYNEYEDIL